MHGNPTGSSQSRRTYPEKEERYVQNAIQSGIQGVFLHGMFFTVWLAVLAVPLAQTIDNSVGILLGEMFTTGSSVVLWALLLFYCSQILKLSGKTICSCWDTV